MSGASDQGEFDAVGLGMFERVVERLRRSRGRSPSQPEGESGGAPTTVTMPVRAHRIQPRLERGDQAGLFQRSRREHLLSLQGLLGALLLELAQVCSGPVGVVVGRWHRVSAYRVWL
ncbi:MAG: hypothetical protein R3A10_11540 [Caldilineaceae bacterium]